MTSPSSPVLDAAQIERFVTPGGDPALVASVLDQQPRKRMLQLVLLRRQLADESPAVSELAGIDIAFRHLMALRPQTLARLVATPSFGAWCAFSLRKTQRGLHLRLPSGEVVAQLAGLSHFALAGLLLEQRTGSVDGRFDAEARIYLPGTGLMLQGSLSLAGSSVAIHSDPCGLRLELPGGAVTAVELADDAGHTSGSWLVEARRLPMMAGRFELNDAADLLEREGGEQRPDRLDASDRERWCASTAAAWEALTQGHPALAEEVGRCLSVIVPLRCASLNLSQSSSSEWSLGAIRMSFTNDIHTQAEAMVHEYHHGKLYALLDTQQLIEPDASTWLLRSPWKRSLRPLRGLLHGAFAFFSVTEFWRALLRSGRVSEGRAKAEIERRSREVATAIRAVNDVGGLTASGEAFLRAIEEILGPVEGIQTSTGRRSRPLARAGWQPTGPDEVALATALEAPQGVRVNRFEDSVTQLDRTLDMLGVVSVTDPARFDALSRGIRAAGVDRLKGHLRYLDEDYAGAAEQYASWLRRFPDDIDGWRDLAFSLRHLGRWPEADAFVFRGREVVEHALERAGQYSEADPLVALRAVASALEPVDQCPADSDEQTRAPLPVDSEVARSLPAWLRPYVELHDGPGQVVQFLAMYAGVKPVLDDWVRVERLPRLAAFLEALGVAWWVESYFEFIDEEKDLGSVVGQERLNTTRAACHRTPVPGTYAHLFLSRRSADTEAAAAAGWYELIVDDRVIEKPWIDHHRLGALLGYPECCRRFFAAHNDWNSDNSLYQAHRATGRPDFRCNSLTKHTGLSYACHLPCSFDCEATVAYAARVRQVVREISPGLAVIVDRQLQRPFLVLSEWEIFAFDGSLRSPTRLEYDRAELVPTNRPDRDLAALLVDGDALELDGDVIRIEKSGETIHARGTLADRFGPQVPFLVDFSSPSSQFADGAR